MAIVVLLLSSAETPRLQKLPKKQIIILNLHSNAQLNVPGGSGLHSWIHKIT